MDSLIVLITVGGLLALAWSVSLLLYVARLHHELKRLRMESANLMRATLRALNAGQSLPVATPPHDPAAETESEWFQPEEGC